MTKATSEPQDFSSLAAIRAAASSTSLVDVMISNVWPEPITQFSDVALPSPELASIGVQPAGDIVRSTKPRYFLAAAGGKPPMFWEREPFVWDDEQGRVSRFISLGAFGGDQPTTGKKQRVSHFYSTDGLLTQSFTSGSMPSRSIQVHWRKLPGLTTQRRTRSPSLCNGYRSVRWT